MTLGELNKNVSKLGKQLSKVASGLKIVSAGDGTADYSISERMQAQIRSLRQDIDNTRTGRSMLKVAEGGIQGIVDELREMKQLAINAANDSNTDADRATIQKEFDEKLKQIDDIVATTHYNGKLLLNGEYGRWQTAMVVDDGSSSSSGISTGVAEPSGTPVTLASGNHTITAAGVYVLGAGFSGDITIANGVSGVKIKQANSAQLTDVHIIGPAAGNANLWIEGLNVKNTTDQSWIRFSGRDNVLSIKGRNFFDSTVNSFRNAIINIGAGLTVEGDGSMEMHILNGNGAMIGTDGGERSNANLTINSGTYKLKGEERRYYGACIGAGGSGGSMGDIYINGGVFDISSKGFGANLGSGAYSKVGDIVIKNARFTGTVTLTGGGEGCACIGGGGFVGDITIEESVIHAKSRSAGAGIGGSGSNLGSAGNPVELRTGNISIRNSIVYSSSHTGAGIGSGQLVGAGNITIENMTGFVTSEYGENIGKGRAGAVGTVTINGYTVIPESDYKPNLREASIDGNPLMIHTGTKANQRINCYIENLGTKALFSVKTDEELAELANVCTRASAQRLLGSLTDSSVDGPLDKAINYALNEMTQVGSYINRLEQTEDTLTISHENTTSSESTIRDADMAKEMMEYTKSNVLTQAAQSMLAQANQNSSSVLSLLQ